jgi:hypothetical protein
VDASISETDDAKRAAAVLEEGEAEAGTVGTLAVPVGEGAGLSARSQAVAKTTKETDSRTILFISGQTPARAGWLRRLEVTA